MRTFRQIELIQPSMVATLGNFATKLLSGKPLGITRVHGQPQEVALGPSRVLLYPLYHPAAALYTPSMLKVLGGLRAYSELLDRVDPAPSTRLHRPRLRRRRPGRQSSSDCSRATAGHPLRTLHE